MVLMRLTRPCLRLVTRRSFDSLFLSRSRACTLTYILRALFCEVARPRYNVHIYLQNDTSARVCRCHDSSSEHIQERRTLLNFPYIHSHIQSHSSRAPPWPSSPAFCGLDLAVNQSASLLAASFSPAGAIHQHLSARNDLASGRANSRDVGDRLMFHFLPGFNYT